ncbi:MAG: signal recognition particle subunit SRP19/SEC65 family protein [Nitrososphaerota archaeon]
MIRREGYIIWLEYFDAGLSRSEGRRVPVRLAVKNPTLELLLKSSQKLGWPAEPLDKRHPSTWWKRGASVLVKPPKGVRKAQAIKQLAQNMRERS